MKVLCIDISNPKTALQPFHMITEGEVYTVTGSYIDEGDRHEYYYLEERQMKPVCSYRANRFVPLSTEEDDVEVTVEVYDDCLCR